MSNIVFCGKQRDLTASTCSEKTERTYTTKHGTQAVMNTTNIGKSHTRNIPSMEGELRDHTVISDSDKTERTFIHHKRASLHHEHH